MNYDKSIGGDGKHVTRSTFRPVKGLLSVAVELGILIIFITFNMPMTRIQAGPVFGALSIGSRPASQTSSAAYPVWVQSSLIRVGNTDAAGTASSISLSGARGETVDTQVIVQGPAGGLTNVNLSASALTGPGGATIPASNVTLYREYYLTVTGTASYGGGSNPPLRSGTYAQTPVAFYDSENRAPMIKNS